MKTNNEILNWLKEADNSDWLDLTNAEYKAFMDCHREFSLCGSPKSDTVIGIQIDLGSGIINFDRAIEDKSITLYNPNFMMK